jgi:glucosamine--fructose-6-phosphate aminotransferase (isomerizing)
MVFAKLAVNLARKRGYLSEENAGLLVSELLDMPDKIRQILDKTEETVKKLAEKLRDSRCVCFLGRGINYATALEGRLKLLEVSYIPSLAYPAGESKHGFIALVEKNYPVIFVAPRDQTYDKTISNIMEMKARGADIISIIEDKDKQVRKLSDVYVEIPSDIPNPFLPIACVVPLQLLAYYTAVYRNLDPDMPRNLAKSVTVL